MARWQQLSPRGSQVAPKASSATGPLPPGRLLQAGPPHTPQVSGQHTGIEGMPGHLGPRTCSRCGPRRSTSGSLPSATTQGAPTSAEHSRPAAKMFVKQQFSPASNPWHPGPCTPTTHKPFSKPPPPVSIVQMGPPQV